MELRLIPNLALARTREATHNSWDKKDPEDAQVILHLLKTGLSQIWHDPLLRGINDAQELPKTHHQVTLARIRVWHSLQLSLLSVVLPRRLNTSSVPTTSIGSSSCCCAFHTWRDHFAAM